MQNERSFQRKEHNAKYTILSLFVGNVYRKGFENEAEVKYKTPADEFCPTKCQSVNQLQRTIQLLP